MGEPWTPGPWLVRLCRDSDLEHSAPHVFVWRRGAEDDGAVDLSKADAHLIALAPQMAELLADSAEVLSKLTELNYDKGYLSGTPRRADGLDQQAAALVDWTRLLLAQARGETP